MLACHQEVRSELELKKVGGEGLAIVHARWIEDVLRRAYQIHRRHGGIFGYDLEDWLQAERELTEGSNALNRMSSLRTAEAATSH